MRNVTIRFRRKRTLGAMLGNTRTFCRGRGGSCHRAMGRRRPSASLAAADHARSHHTAASPEPTTAASYSRRGHHPSARASASQRVATHGTGVSGSAFAQSTPHVHAALAPLRIGARINLAIDDRAGGTAAGRTALDAGMLPARTVRRALQRVALARVLMLSPALVIADEAVSSWTSRFVLGSPTCSRICRRS